MLRKIAIIAAAGLLAAALAVLVCTDVKYNNPLDDKGTNYLPGLSGQDSVDALATDDEGKAAYFTNPDKFRCDKRVPELKLVGKTEKVEIYSNDLAGFRKWMWLDGGKWEDLISLVGDFDDVEILKARLTRGGVSDVPFSENKVPDPSSQPYVILYTAQRTPKCLGENAEPLRGSVSRALTILDSIPDLDLTKPVIGLIGGATVTVVEGEVYKDEGVTVTFKGQDIAPGALDSIVITGTADKYSKTLKKPITNYDGIVLPATAAEGYSYNIAFYATASANGQSAERVTRRVTIVAKPTVGLTKAVIVLNPYKHTYGGKTFEHQDTMMAYGGTYVEKGVKRAYYLKDGKDTTAIDVNLVTKPNSPNTSQGASVGVRPTPLNYKLSAGTGYAAADDAVRRVYLVETGCDGKAPPTITASASITIQAGTVWNYTSSWSVKNNDKDDDLTIGGDAGTKYLIDFGGLNPDNPVKGTYTITYVGLGGCGSTATLTSTVKVE